MRAELRTLRDRHAMSLRSRRKRIAPGKRSETKWSVAPPGVSFGEEFLARFSGRQTLNETQVLSPAKAGFHLPSGKYPGFRSLRSLHPGLYSAARIAGSFCVALLLTFCATASHTVAQNSSPRSLLAIHSQSEFDSLAVVYDPNTPYALPHALFVIDRQNKNRI